MNVPLTEKARNLQRLRELLPVPPFAVLRAGDTPPTALLNSAGQLIIRGCITGEDFPGHSLAGQGKTLAPIAPDEAVPVIQAHFEAERSVECILQEYVAGPSGVLMVLSGDAAVLEFSRQPGAVTAGRVAPFVAVFPTDTPRYSRLQRDLSLLFSEFGKCDVEVVNPENPVYVQVRPFVHELVYDEELLRAKMAVQELEADRWVQDEFCTDLLESPGVELGLIELFCEELPKIAAAVDAAIEPISPSDFIRLGAQIFRQDKDVIPHFSGGTGVISAGKWFHQEYTRLTPLVEQDSATAPELMRAAIVFRTYYDLLERLPKLLTRGTRKRVLSLRAKCRERLLQTVRSESLSPLTPLSRRLKPVVEKNGQDEEWLRFEPVGENGVVVVPGDFEQGPWTKYERGESRPEQPCFLVTDELYPDIYLLFPYIKGIICAGGGINSHLALLARESGMPLWIQVPDLGRFLRT